MPTALNQKEVLRKVRFLVSTTWKMGKCINIVDQKIYIRSGNNVETVAQAATGATPIFTELAGPITTQLVVNKDILQTPQQVLLTLLCPS